MDAVTYPDNEVIEFVGRHLVPLRIPFNDDKLATQFNIKWTPTLIVLDSDGNEHYRTVGFLNTEDFMASELLGIAQAYFDLEKFDEALARLDILLEKFPKSTYSSAAIYLKGVASYKNTHDPSHLRHAYDKLASTYPNDEWTKRAYPYRLIPA